MIEKREWLSIAVAILIMALLLSFSGNRLYIEKIFIYLAISAAIILVSIYAKKITAKSLDIQITHKLWELKRYWIGTRSYLKHPIPMAVIFPLLLSFISAGFIKFLVFLQYESKALPSKISKKYGTHRFGNISEWDDALVVFYGIMAVALLAIIAGYLPSAVFPFFELAKYSIYFAAYSMIPFGNLDGMKLFMGSKPLYVLTWVIIAAASLIVFF